jgi:hypothetical protein
MKTPTSNSNMYIVRSRLILSIPTSRLVPVLAFSHEGGSNSVPKLFPEFTRQEPSLVSNAQKSDVNIKKRLSKQDLVTKLLDRQLSYP